MCVCVLPPTCSPPAHTATELGVPAWPSPVSPQFPPFVKCKGPPEGQADGHSASCHRRLVTSSSANCRTQRKRSLSPRQPHTGAFYVSGTTRTICVCWLINSCLNVGSFYR